MINKYKYKYINYIENNWFNLRHLRRLNKEQINDYKEPYRMYLYVYYNYLNELNNYDINQLNIFINACEDNIYIFAANCGNIKILKYLESRGINIHFKNCWGNNTYLDVSINGNIKIMKYLESRGININDTNNIGQNSYKITRDIKTQAYILKNKNYKLNKFSIIYYFDY
jgi:ankyrin repeat protein